MEIKFNISDDKVERVKEAMKGLYPIPVNPDTQKPLFTDNTWAKEVIRRFIVQQVARWEQVKAQKAIKFMPDDTIVT